MANIVGIPLVANYCQINLLLYKYLPSAKELGLKTSSPKRKQIYNLLDSSHLSFK